MAGKQFVFDDSCELFFVAPFWTRTTAVGTAASARPSRLEQLRKHLNAGGGDQGHWRLEKFSAPRTLRLRRYGQIWTEFSFEDRFLIELRSILGTEHFGGVFSRITYFDYGIGCVEVTVIAKGLISADLQAFAERATQIKLRLVDQLVTGLPLGQVSLPRIEDRISGFLTKKYAGLPNRLRPTYDTSVIGLDAQIMCGPVSRNILFTQCGTTSSRQVTVEELRAVAQCYLNDVDDGQGVTGSEIIPVNYVGFEGSVSLVNIDQAEPQDSQFYPDEPGYPEELSFEHHEVRRTKLLWSAAHMYWAAMFTASEGFFAMSADHAEVPGRRLKDITEEIDNLDEYQKILSMLMFESQPEKIVVEGEDRLRYGTVWNAYGSEKLARGLRQIQNDAEATLQSLRGRMQKLIQARVGGTLAIFTLLTVVSVIVDVIILYDVDNGLPPLLRLGILGTAALSIFVLAGVAFLTSSLFGRVKRRKR